VVGTNYLHPDPITQNTNIFCTEDGGSAYLHNAGVQQVTTQKKRIDIAFLNVNSNGFGFTTTFLEAINHF
jgi:hypothetical protein